MRLVIAEGWQNDGAPDTLYFDPWETGPTPVRRWMVVVAVEGQVVAERAAAIAALVTLRDDIDKAIANLQS